MPSFAPITKQQLSLKSVPTPFCSLSSAPKDYSTILKTILVTLGLFLLGSGLYCYLHNLNTLVSYTLLGSGSLLILSMTLIQIVKKCPTKNRPLPKESQGKQNTPSASNSSTYIQANDLLVSQLHPANQKDYLEREIHSNVLNKKIDLWSQSILDLPGFKKLCINGEILTSEELIDLSPEDQQTKVFDFLFEKCKRNLEFTKNICLLLQQGLILNVLRQVTIAKGMRTNNGLIDYALKAIDRITVLEIGIDDFRFVQEQLYQKFCSADEKKEFFKVKILIQGAINNLAEKKMDMLTLKFLFTKEYLEKEQAEKALFESSEETHSFLREEKGV